MREKGCADNTEHAWVRDTAGQVESEFRTHAQRIGQGVLNERLLIHVSLRICTGGATGASLWYDEGSHGRGREEVLTCEQLRWF